ncbi:very short patch repair endonuclease [Pontibacter chinhatensis]|uniref:Very short patch repair endonuclease n=1 Tax=Pontibacter chinhatensis TaxID=1436961 RepID=A0A1I2ZS35_9BACT|nr:very short patch repair endonuclease [Pontibacter chinhatensis]SFH40657.1 T/G mismatch-specific endonuclease [Pontibacter chinhatensis]
MTDVHSKETRSYIMSRVKGKDTKPEILVRKYLHSKGFRYRLHPKHLIGKPDIVLPKYKTVVFVHGCFWHGHEGCKYHVIPKSRIEFWTNKINSNKERDQRVQQQLEQLGWSVINIWECELKPKVRESNLSSLSAKIKGTESE